MVGLPPHQFLPLPSFSSWMRCDRTFILTWGERPLDVMTEHERSIIEVESNESRITWPAFPQGFLVLVYVCNVRNVMYLGILEVEALEIVHLHEWSMFVAVSKIGIQWSCSQTLYTNTFIPFLPIFSSFPLWKWGWVGWKYYWHGFSATPFLPSSVIRSEKHQRV